VYTLALDKIKPAFIVFLFLSQPKFHTIVC
jgi:hypothetical protein